MSRGLPPCPTPRQDLPLADGREVGAARDRARTLLLVFAVAGAAGLLGRLLPLLGAPIFALLLGVAVRLRIQPAQGGLRVLSLVSRYALQAALVLLGATLSLGQVAHVGLRSLPVLLVTLTAALVAAWLCGRLLGIDGRLLTLIGVGTGICGASAIAAVSGVIAATGAEIAYAVSTIFVFNIVAVVVFPPLGHLLDLGQHGFGLWAGTAVNDTSSVVAAAYSYGHAAGDYAVVVKLTRTTMIVPIVLALSAARLLRPRGRGGLRPRPWQLLPWFLGLFLLASALNSLSVFTAGTQDALAATALVLITVALAAVGLSTRPHEIRETGYRPLLLGAVLWVIVATSSLLLQAATGQLHNR